jgi:hypothetical protein
MALPANALTTVETLAYELDIETPASRSAAEADLERRIGVASTAIEGYCGRHFAEATVTEAVPGHGTQYLTVSRTPVTEITSISYDGEAVDAEDYDATEKEKAAGLIRSLAGDWYDTALLAASPSPLPLGGTEQPDYTVEYVGGYVLPKDATEDSPRTLPHDLEEACIQTCVALYRQKGRDQSILSESLMSSSRSYAGSTSNTAIGRGLGGIIPDAVVPLLEKYRRWV